MPIHVQGLSPLLQVYDMPTAIHFYRDTLQFNVVSTSPRLSDSPDDVHWVLLQRDGFALMLNTAYDERQRPADPDRARVAAHHDTILYFACPDVDAAYTHLSALGLKVKEPTVSRYGMKQLYLKDPDGYGICFQWSSDSAPGA